MFGQFDLKIDVTLRPCRKEDLLALEWFGSASQFREVIAEAFQRQKQCEVLMLVAEANHFPIGQLWIDLTKKREQSTGVLWAFRVLVPFQGLGIGTRLMVTAEAVLVRNRFAKCEIGVEKDNPGALRLYERLGCEVVEDNTEEFEYTNPDGKTIRMAFEEWIM
jgi:ribosomal protein S18 acetylase RimI-like enzyme